MDAPSDPRSLPDVGHLVQQTGDDLRREPGGWLLAGLAFLIVGYALPIVAFVVLAILMIPAFVFERQAPFYAMGVAMLVALVAAGAIGPFLASFYRAARDHVHGIPLSFSAPFRSLGQDAGPAVLITLLVGALIGIGSVLFVVPGLIAAWLLMWAPPLVYLHRRGVGEAVTGSVELSARAPGWTLLLAVIGLAMVALAGAFPVVGPLVLAPIAALLHARAFEAAFGAEPVEARPVVPERTREELPPGPPIEI